MFSPIQIPRAHLEYSGMATVFSWLIATKSVLNTSLVWQKMISVSFFQSGNIIVLSLKQNHQSLHDKHLPPVNKALVSCRPGVQFLKGRVFCAFSSGSLRSPKWKSGRLPCRLLGPSGKLPEKKWLRTHKSPSSPF